MNNQTQSLHHHAFIATTDRKSLYTQLKNLVERAQEVAKKELEERRNKLKILLEYEDKIYEEEFANTVKSRIDKDIRERRESLLKIKKESTKAELEFLKSKRMQQYMNSCYEAREAFRRKETLHVKECQLEQMREKEKVIENGVELEKYWLKVQDINLKLMDERQLQEDCLKKAMVKQVTDARKTQLGEHKEKLKRDGLEKLQEKEKIDALLEELRLEAFNKNLNKISPQKTKYRNELLEMMKEKEIKERREYQEEVESHQKLMNDIAREKAVETMAIKEKQKAFRQATEDFINFVKGVRRLEEDQEQLRNKRIQELGRINMCTKRNILLERQRKTRVAEQCYAALREQICEQSKLRLQEDAEYRECNILENRFARREITRAEILSRQQKFREELDKQIEEQKQLRQAEEAKFSFDLQRASNDPEFCAELAEKYIKEGIDYLEPHPNWHFLNYNSGENDVKSSTQSAEELLRQGAVPKQNFEPCSPKHKNADGRGDETL